MNIKLINYLCIVTLYIEANFILGLDISKFYKLIDEEVHLSCTSLEHEQISLKGNDVFKSSSLNQPLEQMTIGGWYMIRGYSENQIYTIFSIKEGAITLMQLDFKIVASQFSFMTLFSVSFEKKSNIMKKNIWVYIYTSFKFHLPSTQVDLSAYLFVDQKNELIRQFTWQTSGLQFDKQKILFQFGYQAQSSIFPFCGFAKDVVVYWDQEIDILKYNKLDTFTSFQVKQHMYLDSTYITATSVVSSSQNNQEKLAIISPNIQTDSILFNDNGFVLSFYFKFIFQNLSDESVIASIEFQDKQIYNFIVKSTVDLYLETKKQGQAPTKVFYGNIINKNWAQVIFILRNVLQIEAFLIFKNTISTNEYTLNANQIIYNKVASFRLMQMNNSFKIAHFQIYKGNLLSKGTTCLYELISKKQSYCLMCSNQTLLDFQISNQCVSFNPPFAQQSIIPQVKEWFPLRSICLNRIHDKLGACICRGNKYWQKVSQTCVQCPKYCKGCTEYLVCKENDPIRHYSGVCPKNFFDDGYSCIDKYFKLDQNKIFVYNYGGKNQQPIYDSLCDQSAVTSDYSFDDSILDFKSILSFFFSFSFKLISSNQKSTIAYIYESSNGGKFLISIGYQSEANNNQIVLIANQIIKCAIKVKEDEPIWIGLWTDLKQAILVVQTNGQKLYQKVIDLGLPFLNISKPIICVGPCNSGDLGSSYGCGSLEYSPFIFIKDMAYPSESIDRLFSLMQRESQLIATFQIAQSSFTPSQLYPNIINLNQLDFKNTLKVIKKYKGFQFINNVYASINLIQTLTTPFTFSCSLFILNLIRSTQLVTYNYNNQTFQIFLIPHEDIDQASIRICLDDECVETNYAMIYFNEYQFLMINSVVNTLYQPDFLDITYEVVCEHKREYLNQKIIQSNNVPYNSIQLGEQTNTNLPYEFYMGNIKFYEGNAFLYFELSYEDHCFLYTNLKEMKCVLPKKGFVFYQDKIIAEDECIELSEKYNKIFAIDQLHRTCLNTNVLRTKCIQIELETYSCIKCRFDNSDPKQFCECLPGYFYSEKENNCNKCAKKCRTCQNQLDNCIECSEFEAKPPSCNCMYPFQYLDENSTCQYCSRKCKTCELSPDNCIECEDKRENPPECNCKAQLYEERKDKCQILECQSQCLTCSFKPNQCEVCNKGRINPPQCLCMQNFKPLDNGECHPCPPSTFYDINTNSCQGCQKPCQECAESKENCLFCDKNTIMVNNQCVCIYGSFNSDNGTSSCSEEMDVQLQIKFVQTYYLFVFSFDYPLKQVDLSTETNFLDIFLSQIPINLYKLVNFSIKENKLTAKLQVKESFNTISGSIQFQNTNLFKSQSEKYVLGQQYQNKPIKFEIGPFVFTEDILEQKQMDSIEQIMKDNDSLTKTIQKLQIPFYFLNTIQPTALFLLINMQFPPNLYKFYQIFGQFVFPDVSDYSIKTSVSQFNLFGISLNKTEVYKINNGPVSKLNFTNSLLINIPLIVIKYMVILLLISILKLILSFNYPFIKTNLEKLQKVKLLLIQQLYKENEVSLLLSTLSIICQFLTFEQNLWASRYGLYLGLSLSSIVIISNIILCMKLNKKSLEDQEKFKLFTDRLNNNNSIWQRNYFFFQMIKKYLALVVIFFCYELPVFVCAINGMLFFISLLYTLTIIPYKSVRSRIIKILGELILSVSWILHIFVIRIEQLIYQQTLIDKELISIYIGYGKAIIFSLFIFNLLFLFEFIASIIQLVYEAIKSLRPKQDMKDIFIQAKLSTKKQQLKQ